jgi:phosphatidylinositol 3-kinase
VRSYAIETLSNAPDEELRLYLLQLVQALKYEEDVSGGFSGSLADGVSTVPTPTSTTRVSSLSSFLIDRASSNVELANYLFWYLRVELENRMYESRYREVFLAFKERLSSTLISDGSIVFPGQPPPPGSTVISLWELFSMQEGFVSGILRCQLESLTVRGKKDAKEKHLREALAAGGFYNIPHAVPLPSAPHIWVKGVDCNSAKMFKSALYPAVLSFVVDCTKGGKDVGGHSKSIMNAKTTYKVMIKTGDDLRQDQLVIIVIQLMDRLLKRGTLDLW